MRLLALDFETYYAADFTLKKLTNEEYIRDSRFKVHCLGIRTNDLSHAVAMSDLSNNWREAIKESAVICHHAQFDGLILSHVYGIKPRFWIDTLSMARLVYGQRARLSLEALAERHGLKPKTVPYDRFIGRRELDSATMAELMAGCAHDVDLTWSIAKELLRLMPREELHVIDQMIRCYTEPALELDRDRLAAYLADYRVNKARLLADAGLTEATLRSDQKLAEALTRLGVEPPIKISPRTGKSAYAFAKTDDGMKELLNSPDDRIATIAEARIGSKTSIVESRCERLLAASSRGRLPVYLYFYGAHTGRFSGGDNSNYQNLPNKGEIRKSLIAPRGQRIVVADSSQIECRLLNYEAGEEWVLQAFAEGRDIYSENATQFYGRNITKADKLERHLGKTIELGCGFGMGGVKFQATCRGGALGGPPVILSLPEAQSAVELYRRTHPRVVAYWKQAQRVLQDLYNGLSDYQWGSFRVKGKRIYLPNGAWVDYSDLVYEDGEFYLIGKRGKSKIYGGKLVENVIQALARVVLTRAWVRIAQRYKVITTTHDEIIGLAPEAEADEALEFFINELKRRPDWVPEGRLLPLNAEGGHAENYSK